MNKVFVTGGASYVGAVLVPHFMGKIFTYKTAAKVVDIGSITNYNQPNNSF